MKADHSKQIIISVLPATSKQWADVDKLFSNIACWCQYWRFSASEYGRIAKGEEWEIQLKKRRNALRTQLEQPNPPGILAYVED